MAAPAVYAIGDVNGQTLLAHAAEHQGDYVARHILEKAPDPYASGPVPSCVYGSLEIMRVGMTERQALAEGGEVMVSRAQLMSNAIAQGDVQAINYFIAQKYVEAFKELAMAPNQKFVLMPMEASGVIGSIAGIAELAKEALNKQQVAAPSRPPRVPGA